MRYSSSHVHSYADLLHLHMLCFKMLENWGGSKLLTSTVYIVRFLEDPFRTLGLALLFISSSNTLRNLEPEGLFRLPEMAPVSATCQGLPCNNGESTENRWIIIY